MSIATDPSHFARAVTELGERRKVVAHQAIYNAQGLKILDKGVAIDSRLYDRLSAHQLRAPLDECVESEAAVTGAEVRDAVRALAAQEPLLGALLAKPQEREVLLEEISLLPLPPAVAFQVTLLRDTQPVAWMHALRSALLAAWLALRQGQTRHDMRMLAAAGLLHDLGMLHLEPVLMQPELALSSEQRRQLYTHPLLTVMLLERHHAYSRECLRAVLEHHEALDGSGYPRQIDATAISPWGRLLALTEVASSLGAQPEGATRLSLVLRMNAYRHDPELVRLLQPVLQALRRSEAGNPASAGPAPAAAPGASAGQGRATLDELRGIGELLQQLPAALPNPAPLPPPRKLAVERMQAQAAQMTRVLAGAGVTLEQLGQLQHEALDPHLDAELTLLAQEASWQLRALTRQLRRRWNRKPDEAFPPALGDWVKASEALSARRFHG